MSESTSTAARLLRAAPPRKRGGVVGVVDRYRGSADDNERAVFDDLVREYIALTDAGQLEIGVTGLLHVIENHDDLPTVPKFSQDIMSRYVRVMRQKISNG